MGFAYFIPFCAHMEGARVENLIFMLILVTSH